MAENAGPAAPDEAGEAPALVAMPVGDEVRLASARDDHEEVARLINAAPFEAWFAIPPDEMAALLHRLPAPYVRGVALRMFRTMVSGHAPSDMSVPAGGGHRAIAEVGAKIFGARLRGRTVQSNKLVGRAAVLLNTANVLFDDTRGWRLGVNVQNGINEMLIGEFTRALESFAQARQSPPPSSLTVMYRDAYVKSGLIHALFGDPHVARTELAIASTLPRTTSWAEAHVTAHARVAAAVLCADHDVAAELTALEQIPTRDVGELWPFWLEAMMHLHFRVGVSVAGLERLLGSASLVPHEVEGYAGTVVPRIRAMRELVRGDVSRATAELAGAPTGQLMVELARATIESASGDWEAGLARAVGVRRRTVRLPRLEAYRVVTVAGAVRRSGDEPRTRELLASLVSAPGELGERLIVMPRELHEFAVAEVPGWPERAPVVAAEPVDIPRLTARELEVLQLMATDQTREEIAAALFVSVNTIKSQQRSLSRKLGVTGRANVLLEAERWGLLE